MKRTDPRSSWPWASGYDDDPAGFGAERWELIDAPWGSGSWLLAIGVDEIKAWAPPGVLLTGADDEPVEWWKSAVWIDARHEDLLDSPDGFELCRADDVHARVPADFRPWVLACTEGQLRVLARFVRSRSEDAPEAAEQASNVVEVLQEQLKAARRPTVDVKTSAMKLLAQSFKALSDHDFALLVSDLVATELQAPVRYSGTADSASYVMRCEVGTLRILFQIRHDITSTPREVLASAEQEAIHCMDSSDVDEHWLVTSAPLPRDLAPERDPSLPLWRRGKGRICDLHALGELFGRHPTTVSRHLKFKVAGDAGRTDLDTPDESLAWYAQTAQAEAARDRLHQDGMVIVHGGAGTGKTALAQLLLVEARLDGYRPVHVDSVESLQDALRTSEPQAILWDDFVPSLAAFEALRVVRDLSRSKFVLTTALPVDSDHAISLNHYSRRDRARILYNHLWAAWRRRASTNEPPAMEPVHYLPLIEDPSFSPRRVCSAAWGGPQQMPLLMAPSIGAEADEESHHLVERIRVGAAWSGLDG